jgi:hypothetical protein
MPINRKSQSRRSHVEKSKRGAHAKYFDKEAAKSSAPDEVQALKEERKQKRSTKKR